QDTRAEAFTMGDIDEEARIQQILLEILRETDGRAGQARGRYCEIGAFLRVVRVRRHDSLAGDRLREQWNSIVYHGNLFRSHSRGHQAVSAMVGEGNEMSRPAVFPSGTPTVDRKADPPRDNEGSGGEQRRESVGLGVMRVGEIALPGAAADV